MEEMTPYFLEGKKQIFGKYSLVFSEMIAWL